MTSDGKPWTDELPTTPDGIPSARGVPIRMEYLGDDGVWRACYLQDQCLRDAKTTTVREDDTSLLSIENFLAEDPGRRRILIDLDDSQGFAYVLLWWSRNDMSDLQGKAQELTFAWFRGPSDEERLLLARECRNLLEVLRAGID